MDVAMSQREVAWRLPFVNQRQSGGTHSKEDDSRKVKDVQVLHDLTAIAELLWGEARLLSIANQQQKAKHLEKFFCLLEPNFWIQFMN